MGKLVIKAAFKDAIDRYEYFSSNAGLADSLTKEEVYGNGCEKHVIMDALQRCVSFRFEDGCLLMVRKASPEEIDKYKKEKDMIANNALKRLRKWYYSSAG